MPRGGGAPGKTWSRRRGILGTQCIFCDGPGLPSRLICKKMSLTISKPVMKSFYLPWKLLFWDRTLKILTERPPTVRHIEQKDVVVAFVFNLLIPVVVKSTKVKTYFSRIHDKSCFYFLAESSSTSSFFVNWSRRILSSSICPVLW